MKIKNKTACTWLSYVIWKQFLNIELLFISNSAWSPHTLKTKTIIIVRIYSLIRGSFLNAGLEGIIGLLKGAKVKISDLGLR